MTKSLQERVEEKTYNILFELEDELGIKVKILPEIYYVKKCSQFENFGLHETFKPVIDKLVSEKSACTMYNSRIIFTSTIESDKIAEEAGHYIHFQNVEYCGKTREELFSFKCISEMIGYFCSKLIDSSRKNQYRKIEDFFPSNGDVKEFIYMLKKISNQDEEKFENAYYVQGYTLGEKLFNNYISGNISKNRIKKLIQNPLNKKNNCLHEFYKWKYQILK